MNAFSGGTAEPIVVVQSALLDQLNDTEVTAVLGHELAHIQAEHGLYRWMAQVLVLGGLRLGAHKTLLTVPVELGLLRWSRCAELTCDRASLLVTRDLQATLRMLMTLAAGRSPGTTRRTETSLAAYIRQARSLALEEATSVTEGLLAAFLTLGVSHPFAPWRVMHLIEWVERGSYLDILAGHYERRRPDAFTAPWSWEIATWDLLGAVDFPEP
jgi:Zn-dependent protease with chaperone function